jgi:hypothetical protein
LKEEKGNSNNCAVKLLTMERSSGRARKASQKVVDSREVFEAVGEVVLSKRKGKSVPKDKDRHSSDGKSQKKGPTESLNKQPGSQYHIPVATVSPANQFIPSSVALSLLDKAAQISVSADQMTCTGTEGGFRMIRATHGVHFGPYYWECEILPSPSAAGVAGGDGGGGGAGGGGRQGLDSHVRVGWSTRFGELRGPVGYNKHSYGYRDVAGECIAVYRSAAWVYALWQTHLITLIHA